MYHSHSLYWCIFTILPNLLSNTKQILLERVVIKSASINLLLIFGLNTVSWKVFWMSFFQIPFVYLSECGLTMKIHYIVLKNEVFMKCSVTVFACSSNLPIQFDHFLDTENTPPLLNHNRRDFRFCQSKWECAQTSVKTDEIFHNGVWWH